jgi:hypothetical protein
MFKGPGSFKKMFKIGGNVGYLKAYRLIPLNPPPPLLFHFTVPITFHTEMLEGITNLPVVECRRETVNQQNDGPV